MAMVNQGLRLSDLQAGQRVKIHGTPARPGMLVARSISFKEPDETAVIEGPIEALDQQKHTVRVLGLELLVDADAKILDRARSQVGLASLAIGDVAKLKGTCMTPGEFNVASIKLQPAEAMPLAEVQGCVENIDPSSGTLQALGVTVLVTDETSINAFPESSPKRKAQTLSAATDEVAAEPTASVDVSDYLRMPVSGGPRLTHAEGHAAMTSGAPQTDPVGRLIDHVNADVLADLISSVHEQAYLLAFVSGSPVRNRLQSAQSCWPRLVEFLNLGRIADQLSRSFDPRAVEEMLGRLRRTIDSMLLLSGSRVGPAKLLFRLKAMEERLLSDAGYPAIESLVNAMALLSSQCDADTRELLRTADLGKSASAVRRRFQRLLRRFGLPERLGTDQAFDDFVRIQQHAGCLHPALPIADHAALLSADELETSYDLAKRAITLFRFAWLCGEDKAEGVSDFAIKGLAVIPYDGGTSGDARQKAENALDRAYDAVLKATGRHAGLQQFRAKYPDVRVEVAVQVVALPKPLFDLFVSFDGEDERRIDFLTRYRLGADHFATYLAELGRRSMSHLFDGVVFLSAKEGKKRAKRGRLEPFALDASTLRDALERMAARQDEADISEWSWRLNEIAKCDLVGRIRGVWTIKAPSVGASPAIDISTKQVTVKSIAQRLSEYGETPFTLPLRFGEYDLVVRSNSELMIEKLRDIYRYFVNAAAAGSGSVMTIVDAVAPELGLTSARSSAEGEEDSDDDFCDLADGRVVWRRSKGILFASGEGIELAILPCAKHGDKVVNFINTRYIQWHLHRSGVLAHASSVTNGQRGLLLAGAASAGKTTLAFRLLDQGVRLVGKDNVIVRYEASGLRMYGTPSPPRVNSGTALRNARLRSILDAKYAAKLERLSREELWAIDKKHPVFIEELYGPNKTGMDGPVDGIVVLNWRHQAAPTDINRVEFKDRPDLLEILMKSRGRFYRRRAESDHEPDAETYLQLLGNCPVYEVTGGIDFEQVVSLCTRLLGRGAEN
jgi:HprK-related kinase B